MASSSRSTRGVGRRLGARGVSLRLVGDLQVSVGLPRGSAACFASSRRSFDPCVVAACEFNGSLGGFRYSSFVEEAGQQGFPVIGGGTVSGCVWSQGPGEPVDVNVPDGECVTDYAGKMSAVGAIGGKVGDGAYNCCAWQAVNDSPVGGGQRGLVEADVGASRLAAAGDSEVMSVGIEVPEFV
jgi:hypothetical protein